MKPDDDEEPEDETNPYFETSPNEVADRPSLVREKIPADLCKKYEILSYRSAAVILSESRREEFADLLEALRTFTITRDMIRRAGGNESDIPKLLDASLRKREWYKTRIYGDLVVHLNWREQVGVTKKGKAKFETRTRETRRDRHIAGHEIDFVKGRVAFDMEWNSKDQTFDRDLYAFNAFFLAGIIDVGVLLTRGKSLNPIFRGLGQALTRKGVPETKVVDGVTMPRMTHEKYGASTTWWGKLIYRLNAGRNGGCPVLAVGITPACISDWPQAGF